MGLIQELGRELCMQVLVKLSELRRRVTHRRNGLEPGSSVPLGRSLGGQCFGKTKILLYSRVGKLWPVGQIYPLSISVNRSH